MRMFPIVPAAVVAIALAGPALADEALDAEGRTLMEAFTEAVIAGPDAVDAITAPEYQIMRSNGVGYDHAGYVASVGSVDIADYAYEEVVATADGDIMVVRSMLSVNETIGGESVTRRAPRLTVFRKIDGEWKVVSHANFAHIGDAD